MYNVTSKDRKPIDDYRKLYVPIGCGNCIECRKQKAREWQVRLSEELKMWKYKYFVTLTFSPESLRELCEEDNLLYDNVNSVASKAIRRFLERWRKEHKKSLKHWFITELGHENTERIHLHGIIFSNDIIDNEKLSRIWKYGKTDIGDYCNDRTINYIVKYVTKIDLDHKQYKADIFCSAGIGSNYFKDDFNKYRHAFRGKDTIQYYTLKNGNKIALPLYYRNHFWTDEERQKLWTDTLDKDETYVRGVRIKNISKDGYKNYLDILETQQRDNIALGYGNNGKEWSEKIYKVTLDMLKNEKN